MEHKALKKSQLKPDRVERETSDERGGMLPYAVTGHRRQTHDRGRVSRAQTRVGEHGARRAPGEQCAAQRDARAAGSGQGTGSLKKTIRPSPVKRSSVPSKRKISSPMAV